MDMSDRKVNSGLLWYYTVKQYCWQTYSILKLFQRKKAFESEEHKRSWLIRVAVNESHNISNAEALYSFIDGESFTAAFRNIVNASQVTEVSVNGITYVKKN